MQETGPRAGAGMLPPAVYVNFLRVAQRQSEMFLVFGQVAQDRQAAAHAFSSFVTSPAHAKAMLGILREAVERYEARFGAIPEIEAPAPRGEGAGDEPGAGGRGRAPRSSRPRSGAGAG